MSPHLPFIIGTYLVALVVMGGLAVSSFHRMRTLKKQVEQLRQLRRAARGKAS